MRSMILLLLALVAGSPAVAESLGSQLDELLKDPHCGQTPPGLTFNMPDAPLGKVFATIASLLPDCPASRFNVDPDVASVKATVELKNVNLATMLDVLAANQGLIYVVEDGRVQVRRKPRTDQRAVSLNLVIVGAHAASGSLSPSSMTVPLGTCAALSYPLGGPAALRLHPWSAVLEKDPDASAFRVRLCPEKTSGAGLELLGEAMIGHVSDDGYHSREERTIFRRTVGDSQKDVSLFKASDDSVELKLSGYKID